MRIGFIGFGKMGKAIAKGLKKKVLVYDPNFTVDGIKAKPVDSIKKLLSGSDVVILAVKPQVMDGILEEIRKNETKGKTFISIAAGISIPKIEQCVKGGVIRAMPNIACAVGEGAIALSKGESAEEGDLKIAIEIMENTGKVFVIEEKYMDLVTAYTGAAPAYFALLVKFFYENASLFGLDPVLSKQLMLQTAKGTAKLLEEYEPEQIIKMVATPGGITEQGLKVLEDSRETIKKVLEKGMAKTRELG